MSTKVAASADGTVELSGLTPGADIRAGAYAIVGGVVYYGNEVSFKTPYD